MGGGKGGGGPLKGLRGGERKLKNSEGENGGWRGVE